MVRALRWRGLEKEEGGIKNKDNHTHTTKWHHCLIRPEPSKERTPFPLLAILLHITGNSVKIDVIILQYDNNGQLSSCLQSYEYYKYHIMTWAGWLAPTNIRYYFVIMMLLKLTCSYQMLLVNFLSNNAPNIIKRFPLNQFIKNVFRCPFPPSNMFPLTLT